MKAHKTHKSPLIICTESRGCAGSSGVLLYASTDRSRATHLLSHHLLTRRLLLSEETLIWRCAVTESNGTDFEAPLCVACPMWTVWGLLRPMKFWGKGKKGEPSDWRRPPLFFLKFKYNLHAPIFPIDPVKSYLGLGLRFSAISGARHLHPGLSSSNIGGLIISHDRRNVPSGSLITGNPFFSAEDYKWLRRGRLKCHTVEGWDKLAIIADRLLFPMRRHRKRLTGCHCCREAFSLIQ